ncbi:unnamed protein product [Ilex paraguariensis]|uniref:Uncharacterized protein n=1 Tax=Ilex paraguariensis TaxID=185542 RepID=A0ABC8SUN6_9AQUA
MKEFWICVGARRKRAEDISQTLHASCRHIPESQNKRKLKLVKPKDEEEDLRAEGFSLQLRVLVEVFVETMNEDDYSSCRGLEKIFEEDF